MFELEPLSEKEIVEALRRALADAERGLGRQNVALDPDAAAHWAKVSDGDARRALNALEIAARTAPVDAAGARRITRAIAEESIQKKAVRYDADEDAHYDTISAFIKSVRGSDPDAAIYWLAKMLYAGEDPRFIARRLALLAAEDIGLAEPGALVVANACFQIVELIGMPEARIPLAETTIYLAGCPKSNSADKAIEAALKDVKEGRLQEVPRKLRGTGYRGAEKLGHGVGYRSPHDHSDHYVEQAHMPVQATYYAPSELGRERKLKEYLESVRAGAAKRKKAS